MNPTSEWRIKVPWGTLTLIRWGQVKGEPVLVIHGRQDSSSVFIPLINQMPQHYNYVALDMPGNGLSDAFPKGPKLTRLHFLGAMELALEHLGWVSFIFMGHSMGCEQGLFFNAIYPGRITKMILLDAGPTLMRMQVEDPEEFQRLYYDSYYENYHKENFEKKIYTRQKAVKSLRRMRDMTELQACHLLERNFHPLPAREQKTERHRISKDVAGAMSSSLQQSDRDTTTGQIIARLNEIDSEGYLSWDNRLKHLAPTNYGNDYYYELFKNIPPTLLIHASEGAKRLDPKWRPGALQLIKKLDENVKNFHIVYVEGGHDVHYTHPERVAPYVVKFLDEKIEKVFCKL